MQKIIRSAKNGLRNISITRFENFSWYNVSQNTQNEIIQLKKIFDFRDENLQNCLPPIQRPKIIKYHDYIFMILLFPYYDHTKKEVKISEVDFFINQKSIVTIHENKLPTMLNLAKKYNSKNFQNDSDFTITPELLVFEIIENLSKECFTMLNHMGLDIDSIEEMIFNKIGEKNVKEILLIKRNILNFRKALQAHKSVLKKLQDYIVFFSFNKNMSLYFEDLVEQTKDIWDILDNYKETIEALYNSNESLSSIRLNNVMKMLTIISVLTFPLTLFVTLFSTKLHGTPFANHPFGFWILVIFVLIGACSMLYAFKYKKWF